MTLEREHVAEVFGLVGTFPRPGWVVLDAARDHRFTGELIFHVDEETRVYFDQGSIYLAELTTDPSLGARLVEAGALNTAQLEHGSMQIGDAEHLGRLFDRVPSVDRQTTIVVTEMMNEACIAWLARQQVHDIVATPYRHHPSGIHRWQQADDAVDLRPGDPLPSPAPTAAPADLAPPESVCSGPSHGTDPLIHWDEPSWLDDRPDDDRLDHDPLTSDHRWADDGPSHGSSHGSTPPAPPPEQQPPDALRLSLLRTDWVDALEMKGLPQRGDDPLTPTVKLPPLPVEPLDRFELIWPSGQVDAEFPASIDGNDDLDRTGPTARVARNGSSSDPDAPSASDDTGLWDFESSRPSFGPDDEPPTIVEQSAQPDPAPDELTDDVALSMRRAVASIETGSLAARRRLAEAPVADDSSRGTDLVVPGRVATRTEAGLWSATRAESSAAPSVFDEPATLEGGEQTEVGADPQVDPASVVSPEATGPETEPARVSALRRLIGGLRRQ